MADRKDEIGAKHTRWSRPDSTPRRSPARTAGDSGQSNPPVSDMAQKKSAEQNGATSTAATDARGDTTLRRQLLREMLLMRVLFRFDTVQHYTQSLNDLLAPSSPNALRRP